MTKQRKILLISTVVGVGFLIWLKFSNIALGASLQTNASGTMVNLSITEFIAAMASIQVALRIIADLSAKFVEKTKNTFDNKVWKFIVWLIDFLGWLLGIFGAGSAKTRRPF